MPPAERVLFLFRVNPPVADSGEMGVGCDQGVECHLYLPEEDVEPFMKELRNVMREHDVGNVDEIKYEVL